MSTSPRRAPDRVTKAAGLAALAIGVLAIGGAPRWAVIAITVLAAVAAASQVGSRRRLQGVSPLLVVLAIAAGLTALQVVPVPDAVVAALNPAGHELVTDGHLLLDPEAASQVTKLRLRGAELTFRGPWRPLSMDPPTTRVELAELAAYLLLAWMALRVAASERGRHQLLAGVAATAGAVALIGAIHAVLGADKLFGLYAPTHANPLVLAPLLNSNHLASLLVLGALIAGGLAVAERRVPAIRALWIVVAVGCVAGALATRSRGGVMGLAAGATVAAVVMVLQRLRAGRDHRKGDVLRVALPAAVVVLCTLVLTVYLGGGEVRDELAATRLEELSDPRSKYAAWASAVRLIEEAPLLGVGRGGFEPAFTRVHPASSQLTFSHVENEYLQAVVDWGLVGGVALAGGLGFALVVVIRRWRGGPLAAGAIGGLTAVAVHSVVDFGLELPGLAIPTVVVAATLLYVPLKEVGRSRRRTGCRIAVIAGALAAAALASSPLGRTLHETHAALRDAEPTLAEAKAAFARHPLDYLSAAAVARASTDPRERLAFLNHALRLHPSHPSLHRAAARWLARIGHAGQAALEYRLALRGTADVEPLIAEVLAVFPVAVDAVAALPTDYPAWGRLTTALSDAKRHDVALAYLLAIADDDRELGADLWRRIGVLADKVADLGAAERAAIELAALDRSPVTAIGLARVQLRRGKHDLAIATLAPFVADASRDHLDAWSLSCDVQLARPDWLAARDCLIGLLGAPRVTLPLRRKIHGRLAKVEEALGNKERAEFERTLAGGGGEPAPGVDGSGGVR